jgi:hypothetical protein
MISDGHEARRDETGGGLETSRCLGDRSREVSRRPGTVQVSYGSYFFLCFQEMHLSLIMFEVCSSSSLNLFSVWHWGGVDSPTRFTNLSD